MRLTPVVLGFLVVLALSMDATSGNALQSKGKYTKKKVKNKESLIEKYDKRLAGDVKKILLVETKPLDMEKMSKRLVESLNSTEKFLRDREVFLVLSLGANIDEAPDVRDAIKKEEERLNKLSSILLEFHHGEIKLLQALGESCKLNDKRIAKISRNVYQIEWSPKGQWIIREMKLDKN